MTLVELLTTLLVAGGRGWHCNLFFGQDAHLEVLRHAWHVLSHGRRADTVRVVDRISFHLRFNHLTVMTLTFKC